jgi:hypothetical protein
MRATTEAPATHYRLAPETWAEIVEEYLDGATAKEVAAKWKTSAGSVYRWTRELKPGGKRGNGEARARAHARLVAEEEEVVGAGRSVGSRALKGLFAPARADDPDATDPAALAQAATLASGRAMKGRLWAEAKALAGLAETYARLESRAVADRKNGMTIETVDIRLLAEILMHPNPDERLAMWNFKDGTPEHEIGAAYWKHNCALRRQVMAQHDARYYYVRRLVDIIHDLGGKAPEPPRMTNLGLHIGDGVEDWRDDAEDSSAPEHVNADDAVGG